MSVKVSQLTIDKTVSPQLSFTSCSGGRMGTIENWHHDVQNVSDAPIGRLNMMKSNTWMLFQ